MNGSSHKQSFTLTWSSYYWNCLYISGSLEQIMKKQRCSIEKSAYFKDFFFFFTYVLLRKIFSKPQCFANCLSATLEPTSCLDQMVHIPADHHIHDSSLQWIFCIMELGLPINGIPDAVVQGIQIERVRRSHAEVDMIMKILAQVRSNGPCRVEQIFTEHV